MDGSGIVCKMLIRYIHIIRRCALDLDYGRRRRFPVYYRLGLGVRARGAAPAVSERAWPALHCARWLHSTMPT